MFPEQIPRTNPLELLRCRDSDQILGEEGQANKISKADEALAHDVDEALWKDAAFKATDYGSIDVWVENGVVHLFGHVSSLTNQHRAERLIQNIPGLLGINNYLVPDDRLLTEVAVALGSLERTYECKFFTGVSHGIVLLSGNVNDANVKLLAEKCASGNPNVRGVISSIHVVGDDLNVLEQAFLQPTIGEKIFFLNGISGVVRQVIINPDNRRVVAMTVQGRFTSQRQDLRSLNNGEIQQPERLIVISMDWVRYLTKVSGFLYINSKEKNRYADFDSASFTKPDADWVPPYPYCMKDVLIPIEYRDTEYRTVEQLHPSPFNIALEDQSMKDLMPANDSLGG